jgi:hypothetical protein
MKIKEFLSSQLIDEPEKTMGPSGVILIAVLKEESNVKILLPVFSFYC